MDVRGSMLGVGMRSEPKNADAWEMGGRTELTVPSVVIVHVGTRRMSESQAQARAQQKTRN